MRLSLNSVSFIYYDEEVERKNRENEIDWMPSNQMQMCNTVQKAYSLQLSECNERKDHQNNPVDNYK